VPLVAPGNWVVMGSSTPAGAGARILSWVEAVKEKYSNRSVAVFNIAKGGKTTYEALPTATPLMDNRPAPDPEANVNAALAKSPKLLIISFPSNDTVVGFSVDETVQNLLQIRAIARSNGASVIVVSMQPLSTIPADRLAPLAEIDTRLAAAVAPCFVATREALAAPDGTLDPRFDSGDGVHVNDDGHAVIAAAVEAVIDSGACVRASP
jgi:acyl-CoA thioesterase I